MIPFKQSVFRCWMLKSFLKMVKRHIFKVKLNKVLSINKDSYWAQVCEKINKLSNTE